MSMSLKVRVEILPRLRQRYANRGVEGRSRMIAELCEQLDYSRKHAIKIAGSISTVIFNYDGDVYPSDEG